MITLDNMLERLNRIEEAQGILLAGIDQLCEVIVEACQFDREKVEKYKETRAKEVAYRDELIAKDTERYNTLSGQIKGLGDGLADELHCLRDAVHGISQNLKSQPKRKRK